MKLFGMFLDSSRFYFGTPGRASIAYKVELHFCWYDFWVGWYWDSGKRALYICPLPMLAIRVQFGKCAKGGE